MIKYALYAVPPTKEGLEIAQKSRFSRVTKDYALIYSDSKVDGGKEITDKDLYRLTKADSKWLQDCNYAIIFEETKKKEKEISESLSDTINRLEESLKESKEDMENG